MKRTILGLAGITAVFVLWMLLVWLSPAWGTTHGRYWYDQQSCHAFHEWRHHHGSFSTAYGFSRGADTFIRVDFGTLDDTIRDGITGPDLRREITYAGQDCIALADGFYGE